MLYHQSTLEKKRTHKEILYKALCEDKNSYISNWLDSCFLDGFRYLLRKLSSASARTQEHWTSSFCICSQFTDRLKSVRVLSVLSSEYFVKVFKETTLLTSLFQRKHILKKEHIWKKLHLKETAFQRKNTF